MPRDYTPADGVLIQIDHALRTVFGRPHVTERPDPADDLPEADLSDAERDHVARLMRINHTGEVCAQALYQGQALTARLPGVRDGMARAAAEENDHLDWCERRVHELGGRLSLLNPLFYAGSFLIGAAAGLAGDKWSLGFVAETERQVERHLDELACESCHVPAMYAPAVQSYDYTVLLPDSQPASVCRGLEGTPGTIEALVEGYQPVLMPRQNIDGNLLLSPYNLVTSWYWLYDQADGSARPVRLEDLQAAWFKGDEYAPEVVTALDQDGNGAISEAELFLDTAEKQSVIAGRLAAATACPTRRLFSSRRWTRTRAATSGNSASRTSAALSTMTVPPGPDRTRPRTSRCLNS